MDKSARLKAYAKINLSLDITGVLENGYHSIESVFQSISLYDTVSVSLNNTGIINVEADNSEIPSGMGNIAYKAAAAFFEYIKRTESGADIKISKKIPSKAGMGGGSADAAAVLKALNHLYSDSISEDELCSIGEKTGADVPFCIKGGTVFAEGTGNILKPLTLTADGYFLCVAKGKDGVSTVEAYHKFDEMQKNIIHPDTAIILEKIKDNDFKSALKYLGNVFEQTTNLDDVDFIKKTMLENNAETALMTGSGSAVFGIFDDIINAEKCMHILENNNMFADVCKFINTGCEFI
ncbi:MAG TPA: 4-(cytidine 5'-diphospho)-2-C-methyl-D-erythritol kinase [Ruminococcus sp.]|nr:4-(cytidine 5'-diphospho)-2-C-methyl-D-erythritol kinase [Ruminococcus sp.]HBN11818.1 4-(cytidine 5'-diphospho)-2-C-methyl-D-erythritol kinase [Ruminococcus sp.]